MGKDRSFTARLFTITSTSSISRLSSPMGFNRPLQPVLIRPNSALTAIAIDLALGADAAAIKFLHEGANRPDFEVPPKIKLPSRPLPRCEPSQQKR
jgi:hypothetical protein